MAQQPLDQQAQFVVLGVQIRPADACTAPIPQHLLQQGGIVRQAVEVDLHARNDDRCRRVEASVCRDSRASFIPPVPACGAATGARHSHPSSSATNCAEDSAIRPVVLADGQANWPCSSRFVSMHSPIPSCQISLISPARRPRKANTAPPNGSSARLCCTSIAKPTACLAHVGHTAGQVDAQAPGDSAIIDRPAH